MGHVSTSTIASDVLLSVMELTLLSFDCILLEFNPVLALLMLYVAIVKLCDCTSPGRPQRNAVAVTSILRQRQCFGGLILELILYCFILYN